MYEEDIELNVPDAGSFIREKLGLPTDANLSLDSFPDPPEGVRPSLSLPHLVMLAIYNSPRKMLTLQGIFAAIENRFEWYRSTDKNVKRQWQGSIRHSLSLKSVFQRRPKPYTHPGKGQYWYLDPTQGDALKRERKRAKRISITDDKDNVKEDKIEKDVYEDEDIEHKNTDVEPMDEDVEHKDEGVEHRNEDDEHKNENDEHKSETDKLDDSDDYDEYTDEDVWHINENKKHKNKTDELEDSDDYDEYTDEEVDQLCDDD